MLANLLQRIEALERVVATQASIIVTQAATILELRAIIADRDAEIVRLNAIILLQNEKIAKLEARLNTNSSNSSKPPSTDPPWKKKRNIETNGKRGAQKGHTGSSRELVPAEEVDVIVPCKSADLCECGGRINVDESNPERKRNF